MGQCFKDPWAKKTRKANKTMDTIFKEGTRMAMEVSKESGNGSRRKTKERDFEKEPLTKDEKENAGCVLFFVILIVANGIINS